MYRAVDEHGQVIDVYVSARRDLTSSWRFFGRSVAAHGEPEEVDDAHRNSPRVLIDIPHRWEVLRLARRVGGGSGLVGAHAVAVAVDGDGDAAV